MAGWRYVLPVTRSFAAFVLSVIRLTVPDLGFLILSVFLHEILPACGKSRIRYYDCKPRPADIRTPVANVLGTWEYGTAFELMGLGYNMW